MLELHAGSLSRFCDKRMFDAPTSVGALVGAIFLWLVVGGWCM